MKRTLSIIASIMLVAAAAGAQDVQRNDHDRIFADAMTKHHQDGIAMGRMALDKSQDSEIRSMAQKMIDDQSREIDQLQSLRGDGPKATQQEMMKITGMMPESEMQRDMARLEAATGHEFDIAWTEIVAKHHSGAIRMSNDQIRNGANAGLKEIARHIRDKQTQERKQLLAKHEQLESEHGTMVSSSGARTRMAKD